MFSIQIVEYEKHTQAASLSHFKRIVELPKRGTIYDRNGKELAFSIPVDTIGITPVDLKSRKYSEMTKEEIAEKLAQILNLDYNEVLEKTLMEDTQWVLLKKRVEKEESDKLKEFRNEYEIGGIKIDQEDKRVYPQGVVAGTVIGFVNPDGIGQLGLEYQYNSVMTGEPGYTYAQTDNYGQQALPFSIPISLRARDGYNVVSTIDVEIKKIVENELNASVEHNKIA